MNDLDSRVKGYLFGTAIGDAMGVPVEFSNRKFLKEKPVAGLRAFGTHYQPAGTWSDDSALTYQTIETLINGLNYRDLANRFLSWYHQGEWTANGVVFDIGFATRNSLDRLENGVEPTEAGEISELCNGNGSLMRISPVAFYLQYRKPSLSMTERFELVRKTSAITHGHIRSAHACFLLVSYIQELLSGKDKMEAYYSIQQTMCPFFEETGPADECELFARILKEDLTQIPESEIYSSGYVVHSLEAALWCFLTSNSFSESVLKAVNLGDNTDTTGSVTGGLAGVYYSLQAIPAEWLQDIARREDIENLAERFTQSLSV
ncbi:ADP-ribosylglycohydrolase family protein [Siphonobacter sp. SORGH_AS_1065]|uniref:ADP-ribosylglycohydrolase family protein n=1 Tax=Siphonobacter sp. SORGH_AS_1065 TaxID=3041795 RepID=UPI00277F343C|nr:ADP-ribosylglycohydrolase family protein [Siphonobacter sp. SORGH_AS_1065]MDQ1089597.1 ADP-ribosyl-[dinitrogen reductase] hydrolase [Siphonobacter sp. SORGH_AS_1065]